MFTSSLRRKRRSREGTSRHKEVTKLIEELRADLATSKEKMDQRIDELIRAYSSQKEPAETRIWSIRNIFTASYLHGFRELADLNFNGILKTVWLLALLINLLLLAYGMRSIVKDYFEEVTITKVHQIETNVTEINRPSICFPLLRDVLHLRTNSGSNDDLHPIDNQSLLHLGYIKAMMLPFASSGLWLSHIPSGNLTWSEFASLPARPSLSISHEQASLLSQNALYDMLYSWGIGQIDLKTSERSKFQYVTKFHSVILSKQSLDSVESFETDGWICLPISLNQSSWITANRKQLQLFSYRHYALAERTNFSLLHQIRYRSIHFNAKTYAFISSYPLAVFEPIYRHKLDDTEYLLYPTKYINLNLTRQPCYDASGEIYPRGYGEIICFQDCLWKNHAKLFNCSFWEDVNPSEQKDINVCHISDIFHQLRSNMSQMCMDDQNQLWCNNKTMGSVEEWDQLLMQAYRELVIEAASSIGNCQAKCANFMFCEEWGLHYESLYKHDEVKFLDDTTGTNLPSGLIASRTYLVSPFVSVNEDVLKASTQDFMSSLGGIMGLHFGASICGFLHLLLFLLISCCKKIINMANKPLSGGRQSTGASTGEQ